MKSDIIKLIKELIKLAEEIESDRILAMEIYAIILRIMEYSSESISKSIQISIYKICCKGIIEVSDDENLISKLRMDLKNMVKEEDDGIHTI